MNAIYNITYVIFFSEIQLNSLMDFLLYIFTLFNFFDRETCQVKTLWTSQDTQTSLYNILFSNTNHINILIWDDPWTGVPLLLPTHETTLFMRV